MNNTELVFNLIKKIPLGKVATYGEIGKSLNIGPRLVGKILHSNPDPKIFTCHRVVRSDGKIARGYAFGGPEAQISKLIAEGIIFNGFKIVDLKKYLTAL